MPDGDTVPLIMNKHENQEQQLKRTGSYESRYGWKCWTPNHLQFLNKPKWALVLISSVCMNQGLISNGLLHLFVPHIERRFELSSTRSSIIINAYDIGSLVLLLPLTYLGSRPGAHRPRIIGHGAILLGTGSLVFSMPAFLTGPYNGEVITNLCQDTPPIIDRDTIPNGGMLYSLLFLGNLMHGIGATPLSTLSLTYLDDSVPYSKSALYIGVYYGTAIIGPAIGVGIGGLFSRYLNVDFLRNISIPEDEQLTPDSPRWVGCWWLGFVIFGFLFYPLGTLACGLPRVLKGTKELIEMKKLKAREDAVTGNVNAVPEIKNFRSLPSLLWFVVKNPRFDLITVAGCCELLLLTGLGTHFPKLLEQQFNLDPLKVSLSFGLVTVPPCLLGLCIGALIMRIYQLELKGTLLLCTCLMATASILICGIAIHCPVRNFTDARNLDKRTVASLLVEDRSVSEDSSFLNKKCNEGCNCDETLLSPICGFDNNTYFSPCFAGCETEQSVDSVKYFSNCHCINDTFADENGYQAKQDPCPKKCNVVYLVLVGVFLYQTITFMGGVPAITASLRCNDPEFHSLALAVQWMSARLLGAIPGPIILGKVVDSSCALWNISKGVRGSCLLYNHWKLGMLTGLTCFSVKLFQTIIFFTAYILERNRLRKIKSLQHVSNNSQMGSNTNLNQSIEPQS